MPELWPFVPQRKMQEQLTWLTEVIDCKSAEQRLALRNIPRSTWQFNYQLLQQELEAATYLARNYGDVDYYLPVWPELTKVGTITALDTTIVFSTTSKRFKDGGYAFIIGDNWKTEVVEIATVAAGQLNLAAPYVAKSYTNAYVLPCYAAKMTNGFTFKKLNAEYFTASASFTITDSFEVTPANPYTSYNSSYVVTDRPVVKGAVSENHVNQVAVFDNIAGPLTYAALFDYAVSDSSLAWSFDNLVATATFRQWLYITKGRAGSFYCPRWSRDFIVDVDIVNTDTSIIVIDNDVRDDAYTGHIAIIKTDGTQVYAEVTGWSAAGLGQASMDLSGAIGADILTSEVEMITRLPVMRLNSDSISFDYSNGSVVNVVIPIKETPA